LPVLLFVICVYSVCLCTFFVVGCCSSILIIMNFIIIIIIIITREEQIYYSDGPQAVRTHPSGEGGFIVLFPCEPLFPTSKKTLSLD
jgi:hypothetical protein